MLLSASRFADILPKPPRASAAWKVFSLHVVDDPPPLFKATFADHVVTLQDTGTFRFRQDSNGKTLRGWCGPGSVGITPANVAATWHQENSGRSRATSVFIPEAFLSRVIAEDWGTEPRQVELVPQFLTRDPVIEGVLGGLALEAATGSPAGRLYAESACEFLAHHLIRRYSSLAGKPRARGGLSGYRLKVVLDYIGDNIAQPISLRQLAELASVTPRHFERAFRQAVGMAPYAYVIQQRVAAARHLLLTERTLTIEEVALRTGFGSASHLGFAFRRHTGHSPAALRRLRAR